MNELFLIVAHNTVAALALACVVWSVTRVRRNPAAAHLLWLVVLLKLLAPPVMHVNWSSVLPTAWRGSNPLAVACLSHAVIAKTETDSQPLGADVATAESVRRDHRPEVERSPGQTPPAPSVLLGQNGFADRLRSHRDVVEGFLFWLWLGGAFVCAIVTGRRIARFETLLRETTPASERLQRLAREIAVNFRIRHLPDVRSIEWIDIPLLWCAGRRPTIVLPVRVIAEFAEEQSAMILAHEMAHLRRRDHWVRAVELIVSTVYWWNPLVWLIRRQIHAAEELCCDAWVRLAFPNREKAYAEALLKAAELANSGRQTRQTLPVCPFLGSLSLKARIEMILKNRITPSLSLKSMAVIVAVAALVLPSFVQSTPAEARDDSKPAASPAAPMSSQQKPQESESLTPCDSSKGRQNSLTATKSPSLKCGGQPKPSRRAISIGSRERTLSRRTTGRCWPLTPRHERPKMATAPLSNFKRRPSRKGPELSLSFIP